MAQALLTYETNRSEVNRAAMSAQVRRDDSRDFQRKLVIFSLMLLADSVVIYLFWNHGTKKTATA